MRLLFEVSFRNPPGFFTNFPGNGGSSLLPCACPVTGRQILPGVLPEKAHLLSLVFVALLRLCEAHSHPVRRSSAGETSGNADRRPNPGTATLPSGPSSVFLRGCTEQVWQIRAVGLISPTVRLTGPKLLFWPWHVICLYRAKGIFCTGGKMSQAALQTPLGQLDSIWVSLYEKLAASSEKLSTNLWTKLVVDDTSQFDIKEFQNSDIASLKSTDSDILDFDKTQTALSNLSNSQIKTGIAEYPNTQYTFSCDVLYNGSAKILSQTYAINKFTFFGESSSFSFVNGNPCVANPYYPSYSIISQHKYINNGSYFSTFSISLGQNFDHDIVYTLQFDSNDYRISKLTVSYKKKN